MRLGRFVPYSHEYKVLLQDCVSFSAKKSPEAIVKVLRGSSNFRFMAKKFSGYAPTTTGESHFATNGYCFNGGYELIVYPKGFDAKLEMDDFLEIVAFEEIERGTASVNYVPRRFLTKSELARA